jgi:DNA-binding beta-propeller fold protein YncE
MSKRLIRMTLLRATSALSLLLWSGMAHAASAPTLFMIGGASSVSIFDQTTFSEQGYVAAPGRTKSIAVSPDGTRAYVATAGGILVVNTATQLPVRHFVSNNAVILRLSPDGTKLYAANENGSVWVYSTATGFVTQRISFLVKTFSIM